MTPYEEAKLILDGKTALLPTREHLQAIHMHYQNEIILLCHEINQLTTQALRRN